MSQVKLDKIDLKILDTLQKKGRVTNQDLAEKVCLSPSSCLQRVRRLENEGVIKSYHAKINLASVARHIMCIATVSLKNYTQEEFKAFENRIEAIPEVVEFFTVSAESRLTERIPSDRRELRAEPVRLMTPNERRVVERITLVASDCANVFLIPLMVNAPFTLGRPPYNQLRARS